MPPPKPKPNPAATAAALATRSGKQVGQTGRFVELTSRIIPLSSTLAARLFARAHAIGSLPKMGRARQRAVIQPFREVLAQTGLSRRLGNKIDTELFFEIRELMNAGKALETQDLAKFLAQYGGRENFILGKLLERFLAPLEELQAFLKEGAEVHVEVLHTAIAKGQQVVDGLGTPFSKKVTFLPPVPIRNIKRTILDKNGAIVPDPVEFFDNGFASPSKNGAYWTLGSAQEIKTPGVAADISAQVALREPRIKESVTIEFEYQTASGAWRKKVLEPAELVSVPGSMVSVGLTVRSSGSSLVSMQKPELTRILKSSSEYRVIGRGDRQRYHTVVGVPVSNFRAVIRAAIRP